MVSKPKKGPPSIHSIAGLKLGKMYVIETDNPESSRQILYKHAKRAGLRAMVSLGDDCVKLVLWNDKMLTK